MVEPFAPQPDDGGYGEVDSGPAERPHFLILRFHSLGDVILTTGILRALGDLPSRPCVELVTEERFASLFSGAPFVSRIHGRGEAIPNFGDYSRVVDLQASPTSRRYLRTAAGADVRSVRTRSLERRLLVLTGGRAPRGIPDAIGRYSEAAFSPDEFASLTDADLAPTLFEDEKGRAEWSIHPAAQLPGPRVALITGASRRSKSPARGTFASVGQSFQDRGWSVLWVEEDRGWPAEPPVGTRVAVSLSALKSALAGCDLAVSGDSGPMHLATAMQVPVVAVFGSSVRGFGFFPRASDVRVLERDVWCRPCGVHGRDRCWRGGFPCLDVSPQRIVGEGIRLADSAKRQSQKSAQMEQGQDLGPGQDRAKDGSS